MPPRKAKPKQNAAPPARRTQKKSPRYYFVMKEDGFEAPQRFDPDWERTQALADLFGDTPMLPTGANMRPIRSILAELSSTLQIRETEYAREALAEAWQEAVGDFLAEMSEFTTLVEGKASIRTAHPAVRYELQRRREQIILSLNKSLGEGCVSKLSITHG